MDRVPVPKLQPPEPAPHAPGSTRSPDKRVSAAYDLDPLLSLSPSAVIDVLRGSGTDQHSQAFKDVLRDISASEQAFGLRAAIAAKKIEEWHTELHAWQWPGSFEHPAGQMGVEGIFEGSVPSSAVADMEARVETIKDEFDELDLEELKSFVKSAHLMPNSRASSLYEVDFMALSQFQRLDDFTALVTATIMQALPSLQGLRRLLDVWSVRLLVLHQIPDFLTALESTKAAADAAWRAIGYGSTAEKPHVSREAFRAMREVLQGQIADLGSKIDAMLDALEGHQDSLPDHWIDEMEGTQADCENWIVVAEREVEEGEWQARQFRSVSPTAILDEDSYLSNGHQGTIPSHEDMTKSTGETLIEETVRPRGKTSPSLTSHMRALNVDGTAAGQATEALNEESSDTGAQTTKPPLGVSPPSSAASISFSDVSEPRILDASPVQLIRSPVEEKSFFPARDSLILDEFERRASEHTVTDIRTNTSEKRESQSDSLLQQDNIESVKSSLSDLSASEEFHAQDVPKLSRGRSHLSHASVTSIELIARKEVRNINITRSSSNASKLNLDPSKEDTIVHTPTPSALKIEASTESESRSTRAPSPEFEGPLLRVQKQRNRSPAKLSQPTEDPEQDDEFFDAVDTIEPPAHQHKEPKTLEDQLAARISSILSNIPANIKLKTGAEVEGNSGKSKAASNQRRTASAQASLRASRSTTPALTLAPAADKASRPKSNAEQSGIKLYHLHQPDREHPIKLYVRLVGEGGERVMVRVGGGWADLGEYLKEYALHHGRRSVSEGKFEVLGVSETDPKITKLLQSVESGRITPDNDLSGTAPHTPERAVRYREETPQSVDSNRSASYLEEDTPLGLAGPKNKEVELSPKKRAWVNGMLNQARQASAEKKKTNLSELGKVGSTRRFFRGKGGSKAD